MWSRSVRTRGRTAVLGRRTTSLNFSMSCVDQKTRQARGQAEKTATLCHQSTTEILETTTQHCKQQRSTDGWSRLVGGLRTIYGFPGWARGWEGVGRRAGQCPHHARMRTRRRGGARRGGKIFLRRAAHVSLAGRVAGSDSEACCVGFSRSQAESGSKENNKTFCSLRALPLLAAGSWVRV